MHDLAIQMTLVATLLAAAAPQDERFRTRELIDPQTGQWVAAGPGALEGPLAEARALLAEDEGRRARKLLSGWLEAHRDDERYYEGVYLLGEAYFVSRDYWKAAERFETVSENTAGELFYGSVRRTMDVARAFLSGEKRIVWKILRFPAYDEGVELLDRVWERVPGTRLGEQALKLKADYFYARGEMALAQDEYALLASEYPQGRYARIALLRSAEAAEASFPGLPHDDQPLIEADERYAQVQQRYPEFARREQIADRRTGIRQTRAAKDLSIAEWYERSGNPQAAAAYYRYVLRDWPDAPAADRAAERLRALGFPLESNVAQESDS